MSGVSRIEGVDRLKRKLSTLGSVMVEAATEGVASSAEDAKREMQERVRVDTGQLRDSIRIEGDGLQLGVGPGEGERDKALANEFGTSHMSAQPYVVPAAEIQRRDFPDVLSEVISKAVRKV